MNDDPSRLRVDYPDRPLTAELAGSEPMRRFAEWFDDARERDSVPEANAMALATSAADGTPSVRMVLLKHVDPARAAFAWYTNLGGRKAREALANGRAALTWWWPGSPARQVRAVGRVEPVDRARAAAYFSSRPEGARIGAAASAQSRAISNRAELDRRAADLAAAELELPDDWGGFWLVADELELWQGRPGRLHDRIVFLRLGDDDRVRSRAAADAAGGDEQLHAVGTVVTDELGTRWLRARLAP